MDTIFTYGDTMYVPSGRVPDGPLIDHETVHSEQQAEIGADHWWDLYFLSPEFRFDQEAPAYTMQYRSFYLTHKDRNERARYLNYITHSLTGKLYGHLSIEGDVRKKIMGQ